MVHRRSVLKAGAAGVAGTLVRLSGSVLDAAAGGPSPSFAAAIFDPRFDDSVAFAREMRRMGLRSVSASGDIARLWYGQLQPPPGGVPAPLAGLTDRATLFCLEELARSARLKVTYRVEHLIDERGRVTHDAIGPAALIAAARHTLGSRSGFGPQAALLASRFDAAHRDETAAMKRTGPFAPHGKIALASWVIA